MIPIERFKDRYLSRIPDNLMLLLWNAALYGVVYYYIGFEACIILGIILFGVQFNSFTNVLVTRFALLDMLELEKTKLKIAEIEAMEKKQDAILEGS